MDFNDNLIVENFSAISNEVLNGKNHKRSEFVHRLFQYPAMMVPTAQEPLLKIMSDYLPEKSWVFDPFMGSATSLVTAMKYGFNLYGQDINPLSVLISKVKTGPYCNDQLESELSLVFDEIKQDKSNRTDINFTNIDKWFNIRVKTDLSKIRRAILKLDNLNIRRFLWVSFAETIRLTSNDRTSTFKLHARPIDEIKKRNVFPIQVFKELVLRNLNDLKNYKKILDESGLIEDGYYKRSVEINWGDTTKPVKSDNKFEVMFTSPPYGDNHTTVTYGQFSYLPLQWIPIEDICETIPYNYLETTLAIDRKSLGGKPIKEINLVKEELCSYSNTLGEFYTSLLDHEYSKAFKVLYFYNDLFISIKNILDALTDNAFLVWTIGNRHVVGKELNNSKILSELLESFGVNLISDLKRDILNKRMPARNNYSQTMKKENVLIFRK